MNIGESLKFIRKKSGFTQKEMLPNHMDNSTYSRLEREKKHARLNELETILNNLSVTSEEFFCMATLDKEQQEFRHLYYLCANHPDNTIKKTQLLTHYNKLNSNVNKNLRDLSNYIAIKTFFHSYWDEVDPINEIECNQIYEFLMDRKYFFQYDYILVSNLIGFFPENQADYLIKKALPVENLELRDNTTKKFAHNAILNLIVARLHDRRLKKAEEYIKLGRKQVTDSVNYEYKLYLQFFDDLCQYLRTHNPDYYIKLTNIIHTLEIIGEKKSAAKQKWTLQLLTDPSSINIDAKDFPVVPIKEE